MHHTAITAAIAQAGTVRGAARLLEVSQTTLRYWLKRLKLKTGRERAKWQEVWRKTLPAAVAASDSIAGTLVALGRPNTSSGYAVVRRLVKEMGLNTDHWKGQRHGRSGQTTATPLDEVLVENSRHRIGPQRKVRLIRLGVLRNECYLCGQGPVWMGKPLVLVLDHINGRNLDNRRENLRLLCPNCNAQTETFCGRNNRRRSSMASRPL